jgi:hypothetical protein
VQCWSHAFTTISLGSTDASAAPFDDIREIIGLAPDRAGSCSCFTCILSARFERVLTLTKEKLLREYEKRKVGKFRDEALDTVLNHVAEQRFHNHSPLSFEKLKDDPDHIDTHLVSYINGFLRVGSAWVGRTGAGPSSEGPTWAGPTWKGPT